MDKSHSHGARIPTWTAAAWVSCYWMNTPRNYTGILRFSCHIAISETAWWKNIIPVSYCRAAQELLNGVWIMGIHPRELNCATFCMRPFLWVLASSMHKSAYHGARKCLWDIGLQQAESKRVTLSYLESKEWPEKTAKNWNVALDTLPGSACLGRLGWTYPYTITKNHK